MRLRTTVLAAGAVVGVAAITAVIVFGALRAPAPDVSDLATRESTRTLEATGAATPPAVQTADPAATLAAVQPQPLTATPLERRKFDVSAAMAHVRALEAFGVRKGGSAAEAAAAAYIRDQLVALGLNARIEEFPLPNSTTSCNVVARVQGSSDVVLVLGGHMDSKPPSPGANDNGTGCGALLEIAEIVAADPVVPTIEFVFFGSEEIIDGGADWHHFGSRYRVSQMSAAERAKTAGMISLDMIGYGSAFHSRAMLKAPATLSDMVLAHAKSMGIGMTFKQDTSSTGLSDHEAYEKAGMPATCVCWRTDPVYHTAQDVSPHVETAKVATAGKLVLDFVRSLDAAELAALTAR
ncbi:MAG: M28 family peptidase [Coriobacteriia bacterium]|nr:M28 family peptidase [Coriobacteriia bacterium]